MEQIILILIQKRLSLSQFQRNQKELRAVDVDSTIEVLFYILKANRSGIDPR